MKSIFTLLYITFFTLILNGCGIGAIASVVVNKGKDTMPCIYCLQRESNAA